MTKITLDRDTFKALASDTRLDILKNLDGRPMGLNDIAKVTSLNKATLHEHLTKLHEAGLIKRSEREGHKWVYYRLTWKGESLLHPENTKIVVMFTMTLVALSAGILNVVSYIKGTMTSPIVQTESTKANDFLLGDAPGSQGLPAARDTVQAVFFQDPLFLYIAAACFAACVTVACLMLWRYRKNKTVRF